MLRTIHGVGGEPSSSLLSSARRWLAGRARVALLVTVSSLVVGWVLPADAACPPAGSGIVASGGVVAESGCVISTTAASTSGVAASNNAVVSLSNSSISTTGSNSHGVSVATGASVDLDAVTISAANTSNAAAISFQSGGLVTARGGTAVGAAASAGAFGIQVASGTGTLTVDGSIPIVGRIGISVIGAATPAKSLVVNGTGTATVTSTVGVGLDANNGNSITATSGVGWIVNSTTSGIQAQNASLIDLDGVLDINVTGSAANSRGVSVLSGGTVNLDAVGNTIDTLAASQAGVFLSGTGSSARFGQITITTAGTNSHGVQLANGNTVDLGTGSVITASGASAQGVTAAGAAGTTNTITANGLSIATNSGTGFNAGTGTVANLTGAINIRVDSGSGAGLVASGAGTQINGSGAVFDIATSVTSGSGTGLQVSSSAEGTLGSGSTIHTETGTGISVSSAGSLTTSGITVVTNTSQLDLSPILLGLAEYPTFGGDPIDSDHVGDFSLLDLYAIASPAKGIDVNAGVVVLNGATSITAGSWGVNVKGVGGILTANGPLTIHAGPGGTANSFNHGIEVGASGAVVLNAGVTMTVDSVAGSGIDLSGAGGTATVTGSVDIALTNPQNVGINNINEAAAIYAANGTADVTGNLTLSSMQARGYGLWTGANPVVAIRILGNTQIATHGLEAFGLRLDDGVMNLDGNLAVTTGVNPANAAALDGAASAGLRAIKGTLNVTGTTDVTTAGGVAVVGTSGPTRESSYGLWNTSFSRLAGDGAAVTFGQAVTIHTAGAAAHGIYNDTVSGTMTFDGPVLVATTGGSGSVTWQRTFNGILSSIRNETVGAWGVNNAVSGTTTFMGPLVISTASNTSGGVRSTGGTVDIRDTLLVTTNGANAYGLQATSATAGTTTYNGTINVGGRATIVTVGSGAHAIFADLGGAITMTGGATLRPGDPAAFGILASGSSTVTGSGRFDVLANLKSQNNAVVNLSMSPASIFTGTTTRADASVFNLTLVDSLWNMTGSSNLTTLTNDPSLVQFSPPTLDPTLLSSYMTLTVHDYIGAGGSLGLNTFLGGDGAPSDRLVIETGGSATGTSGLTIRNSGGRGDKTVGDGILVVDAQGTATTTTDAFHLDNRVQAGVYRYDLFRSALDGSGESWYLRSALDCPLTGPPTAEDPCIPIIRPGVPLALADAGLMDLYGREIFDTLHQRVGDNSPARPRYEDPAGTPFWGRAIGVTGTHQGDPLGIYGTQGPQYDFGIAALQGGIDLRYGRDADGGTDRAGLYGAIGGAKANVTHFIPTLGPTAGGTSTLNGASLGGYWTHYRPDGSYLDAIVQGTFYSLGYDDGFGAAGTTTGAGLAASFEVGHPIAFGDGYVIEPQAQVISQVFDIASFSDGISTVSFADLGSVVARVGFRLARDWTIETASGDTLPASAWAFANLWQQVVGQPSTTFTSDDGPHSFTADLRTAWLELGVGADLRTSAENVDLYGTVSYSVGFDGRTNALAAKVGLKGQF